MMRVEESFDHGTLAGKPLSLMVGLPEVAMRRRTSGLCKFMLSAILVLWTAAFVAADDTITLGTTAVDPGTTNFSVDVSITNDAPVHAIALSFRYDSTDLTLLRVDPGINTQSAPFFEYKHDPVAGEVVGGIILTYPDGSGGVDNVELAATDGASPHIVATLVFSVDAAATPQDISIDLFNGLGDPAVSNAFSNAGVQVSIPQTNLIDGAVSVNNLYRLRLRDTEAVPDSSFSVTAEVQTPQPISGGSFAYTYDNVLFTADGATYLRTDAAAELSRQVNTGSAGIEFFQFENEADFLPAQDRAVVGFVNDFNPPFDDQIILPTAPDEWKSVVRFNMTVIDDPSLLGQTRDFVLTDANVQGLVDNRFIVGQSSVQPELFHGQVTFIVGLLFMRGNVNGDSAADISDPIFLLQWQFLGIGLPDCLQAADVNRDGRTDISDVISELNWLLLGMQAPPPPVGGCGLDPLGPVPGLSCDNSPCNAP
jgi:hypothetical protein